MHDHPTKTVQLLLALRQFPGFAGTDLTELAAAAEHLEDTYILAGSTVAYGARVPAVHLVLEGALESSRTGTRWGPRQVFGSLEVLARRGAPGAIVAVQDTRTLQLRSTDLLELLEDHASLLASTRRHVARLARDARPSPVRVTPHRLVSQSALLEVTTSYRLDMVDRLIALRHHAPFTTGKIQALAALAQGTEELELAAGTLVHELGEAATGALLVQSGVLRVATVGAPDTIAGAGAELGVVEVLGELPYGATVEAITPARVLRIPGAALLDVLEDHADFALGVLGQLAAVALDAAERDVPALEYELAN